MARVIVLPTSPEKVKSDPGSYRPISLLPVLGKVLERLMMSRMERRMEGRMNVAQHGSVRGRSTETAWRAVKMHVKSATCKIVLGVFVDFKGAFDNLEWTRVIEILRDVGCEDIGLWTSYFRDRKACIVGANEVVWKDVSRGCPQGSICGPFVRNLMMDVLLWRLTESGCECVAYVDDLVLIVKGFNRVELERTGTEWMPVVSEWGNEVGVSVNESKTVMMLMKGNLSSNRRPNVRINDRCVKYADRVKYLGIWMGEGMNFRVHVESLGRKMVNLVGQLRRAIKCDWGLRKRTVRVLYKGLFAACVMYGASAWYECMKFEYARKKLNECQRVVMSACLNVCRTVSTDAMQVLMGGLPWDRQEV